MKPTKSPASRKTVKQRSLWLLLLLIVTAVIAYPQPLNWLLARAEGVVGVNLGQVNKPFVLGLDLQGGTHLEYEADVSKVSESDRKESLNGVRDVIERRVNSIGVSEPLIQTIQTGNSWRVNVELAGISDINKAINLIGETPILEFKEQGTVTARDLTPEEKKTMDANNAEARNKANTAFDLAKKPGADFEALARQYTENEAVKSLGGDLGFLHGKPEYVDVYDQLKLAPIGTKVFGKIFDRDHEILIADIIETKDIGTEINGRHILVSYQGATGALATRSKAEALAKIQGLQKVVTAKNFEQQAKDNSDEPQAKENGGDLKWFAKGDFVEPFEKAVFAQKVATISDIVETEFGYHLIYKIAERPLKDVRIRAIQFKKTLPEDIVPQDPWKSTGLTGKQLSSARLDFGQQTGGVQVNLQFDSAGSKLFQEITKRNIGKPVAIFLDEQPISTPTVQNEIPGGQAVISGNFSVEEGKLLARRLQSGALPVPIKLIAQQTVGPTLGQDSLQRSLKAGLIGFLLVAIFMIALYRLPGVISIIALILYAALSLAVFKLIPVTLTLSGIAGFILSLGIAVDANVLIFERLKEELKEGKALGSALEEAFRRAWPSIRDGHVTVLISCTVLYWFSSSIIRGFALTLAIGIIISLFTAVVSSRTILRLLAGTRLGRYGWLFLDKKRS